MKKGGEKETESNCSLKIHHSHDLYCESLTACSLSIKAKLKWTRESTYIKLCKIVKLIFQLCHLRLHRDWARVKEKEKSIPRILENARVRIHWKLFLHYHSSCLMLPFVWGAGEKLRRGRQRKKCHEQKCWGMIDQRQDEIRRDGHVLDVWKCMSVVIETPRGFYKPGDSILPNYQRKCFDCFNWVALDVTKGD